MKWGPLMLTQKLKKLTLVGALMTASFAAGMTLQPVMAENNSFGLFLQVYDHVTKDYVQTDLDHQKLLKGAIEGMLGVLDDPYTRFISKNEYTQMREEREGSFSGIGIHIGMKDEKLTVIAPIEDTPAWEAGLKAGDTITAIDGKSTEKMNLDDAVKLIRGKEGTKVVLRIKRESLTDEQNIPVTRGKIKNKVVKPKMQTSQVGYIRLTSFMQNDAPESMEKALKDLKQKGMKALILDLRSNPGGLLENAVEIGSLFVDNGPIVRIVDRQGKEDSLQAIKGSYTLDKQLPMVVLIDGGSASASEILAGTLKDNKRATLMGTRSFGKGLVQTVYNLLDGSGLAITTQKYLTSGGTDINKKGIEPHVKVELPKDIKPPYTEAKDVQLQKAIGFLAQKLGQK